MNKCYYYIVIYEDGATHLMIAYGLEEVLKELKEWEMGLGLEPCSIIRLKKRLSDGELDE